MAMIRPLGFVFVLSLLAAGCAGGASPPSKPLMSSLADAKTFGYSERTLAADQVEVVYLAPARRVSLGRERREAEIARARKLAEDLALWRAAQVAMARKARAFRVLNRRTDVNLELRERIYEHSYVPFHYRRRYLFRRRGYFGGYPYDPFPFIDRGARAQAKATLAVALLERRGGDATDAHDAHDARATAARLRGEYPNALGAKAE